jgi:hypothetical protein
MDCTACTEPRACTVQLYLYSPYGPYGVYRASVTVQYSYTSTPPMDRTACTEPQCLYSTAIPLLPVWTVQPVQGCTLPLLSPSPHSITFLCFLSHPPLPFATFSSPYLSLYIPEDSNLMQFSLLPLFLYVMCVQSSSIFFFLSALLLTSDG